MEKPTPIIPEAQSLYKERMSSSVYLDQKIAELKEASVSEGLVGKLAEAERAGLLEEENGYGERLEEALQINVRSARLVLSYFKAEEGRSKLQELTGKVEIPTDDDGLKKFFYEHVETLASMDDIARDDLTNSASGFETKRLEAALIEGADDSGNMNIPQGIEPSARATISLDAENSLKKMQGLRQLKAEIKEKLFGIRRSVNPTVLEQSQALIYEIYLTNINYAISELSGPKMGLREKARLLGEDSLTETERALLGLKDGEPVLGKTDEEADVINSRYDKFRQGASREYQNGWRQQIGPELDAYMEKIGLDWFNQQLRGNEEIRSHGIDPEKIASLEFDPQKTKALVEGLLDRLGILSSEEEIDFTRNGPAKDNKWQVYIEPKNPGYYVTSRKKIFNLKDKLVTARNLFTVALGHEPMHLLQHENKSKIPLKIFKISRIGGANVLKEGGATIVESELSMEFFGTDTPPIPHYIRGMIARQNGGNYLDVVKAYYESRMGPSIAMFNSGKLSAEKLQKAKKTALSLAVRKSKRIMRGSDYTSESGHLTSSVASSYLESVVVAEKLKEAGLDFAFNVADLDLENLVRVFKLGFLKPEEMKSLDNTYTRQLWESEKRKYLL
jgi:hypothetical protein